MQCDVLMSQSEAYSEHCHMSKIDGSLMTTFTKEFLNGKLHFLRSDVHKLFHDCVNLFNAKVAIMQKPASCLDYCMASA